jgi:adenylate kinase family enzyme
MRLLLLAPPGAGKGTQGVRLADRLGVQHGYILDGFPRTLTQATTAADLGARLGVFATTTSPLIDYYRGRGILLAVDADQPPEAVTAEILTRLSDRSSIRERS